MNTVAIIQARMSSSRLPGKVLLDLGGQPLIWHVYTHTRRAPVLDEVVIATGDNPANAPLIEYGRAQGWPVFVGSEDDVLKRFHDTAAHHQAGVIVRVSGDCPLIGWQEICDVVNKRHAFCYDYVSNAHPPMLPDGLDCEAFTMTALRRAHELATKPSDREHCTPWFSANLEPERWTVLRYPENFSHYRLTIDKPIDLEVMRELFRLGGKGLDWRTACALLEAHPELSDMNQSTERNEGLLRSLKEEQQV